MAERALVLTVDDEAVIEARRRVARWRQVMPLTVGEN
jgi:hypothetical protein